MHCNLRSILLCSLAAALPARSEESTKPDLCTQADLLSYLESFRIQRSEWDEVHVAIDVKDARVGDLLDGWREAHGLRVTVRGKAEEVVDDRVNLEFTDSAVMDVLEFLAELKHLSIVMDDGGGFTLVGEGEEEEFAADGWRDAQLMRRALRQASSDEANDDSPKFAEWLRKEIGGETAAIEAKEQRLDKVLAALSSETGIKVEVAFWAPGKEDLLALAVTADISSRPMNDALDALAAALKLDWMLGNQRVEFGRPDWIAAQKAERVREEEARLSRVAEEAALRERKVNVHGERMKPVELAARLESELGVPVRIDLEVSELERTWTFLDRERTLGDVLDEITEENDLEACYREGVLWIH